MEPVPAGPPASKPANRAQLANQPKRLAVIVAALEAQQKDHPDYGAETIRAIVNTELAKVEVETIRAELADDGPN